MAMRRTTIRFGEQAWKLLEMEAVDDGVSVAQYVREAAIGRVVWSRANRGAPLSKAMHDVYAQIRAEDRSEHSLVREAVNSIIERAPGALNALLDALDERDPTAAHHVRVIYGLGPGEHLPT